MRTLEIKIKNPYHKDKDFFVVDSYFSNIF